MKKVMIIGGGGHALELFEYLNYMNSLKESYELIGILDDSVENYASNFEDLGSLTPCLLGKISDHVILPDVYYVLAISSVGTRRKIYSRFLADGAKFCNIIHPHASVSPSAELGFGNVIAPQVIIGPKVKLGNFNLLNGGVAVGHHSFVGDNNILSPNCSLSGGTTLGNDNFFGMNVSTFPKLPVGNSNTVSAGMVLDKPVADNNTIFYRFKEKVFLSPQG